MAAVNRHNVSSVPDYDVVPLTLVERVGNSGPVEGEILAGLDGLAGNGHVPPLPPLIWG